MWPFGIKVSIIEPGIFKTNITNPDLLITDMNAHWDQLSSEIKNQYGTENFEKSKCNF